LEPLPQLFHRNIQEINVILDKCNGMLMPASMHPWMDPRTETRLWPHRYIGIYEAYDHIFDCRRHGWANLQSMHINLPFGDDEEFGKLHAAIRLVLPLLPALAASSPVAESRMMPFRDYRLEVYRLNQAKVLSIIGKVIPEQVFTRADYEERIFQPMYRDIAQYDPEGILQDEWLNSRGAIARWDRNAIEIRVLDTQEHPFADLAIATLVIRVVQALVKGEWSDYERQKKFHEDDLSRLLCDCIRHAEDAEINAPDYLQAFGIEDASIKAGKFWERMAAHFIDEKEQWHAPLQNIFRHGTLSTRILKRIGENPSHEKLAAVYSDLCECLRHDVPFHA
jgi:gamma-glutamyl:cysteine ligase YbdK (ATP-grasp superfamily)